MPALARGGIIGRNPCPGCRNPAQLLCGAVLFPKVDEAQRFRFLICWACGMIRKVATGEPWKQMRVPRQSRRAA